MLTRKNSECGQKMGCVANYFMHYENVDRKKNGRLILNLKLTENCIVKSVVDPHQKFIEFLVH